MLLWFRDWTQNDKLTNAQTYFTNTEVSCEKFHPLQQSENLQQQQTFFFNNKRYQIEICFIKRLRVSPTCIPKSKEEERQVLRNQYISFKKCLRLTRHLIALQCVTSWYFTKASSQRDLLLKVDMSVTANW